jgi:membrane fusion protein, multidrug efflux system
VEPVKLEVGLQNEAGHPHEATLDFVASDVEQGTGTLQARGSIPNKDYVFLPGLFVRVRVPTGTIDDALLITDRALGIDQQGHYALVVGQDDVVQQRPVQIGVLIDGMRVIEQGVSVDGLGRGRGHQRAIPGSKVVPQRIAQSPAAPASPEAAVSTDATPAAEPAAAREPAAQR